MGLCRETREPLAGLLRAGNAGLNTAADHLLVIQEALGQLPFPTSGHIGPNVLVRIDGARCSHQWSTTPGIGQKAACTRCQIGHAAVAALRGSEGMLLQATDQTANRPIRLGAALHVLTTAIWKLTSA